MVFLGKMHKCLLDTHPQNDGHDKVPLPPHPDGTHICCLTAEEMTRMHSAPNSLPGWAASHGLKPLPTKLNPQNQKDTHICIMWPSNTAWGREINCLLLKCYKGQSQHHNFDNVTWLAYVREIPSDATPSRPSNLPAPKLIYFSNLYDALMTHMHSKHKLATQALQLVHTHITKVYFL